jgi:hypothetical protein
MDLPDCGFYRTTTPIDAVPAGRLVYFHNHGDPGPGIYLPESWHLNRAKFASKGTPLGDLQFAQTLQPLVEEGLYRVKEAFNCCEKNCRSFSESLLVQLGYNGSGQPILFLPKWSDAGLSFPQKGQLIDSDRIKCIVRLQIEDQAAPPTHQISEYLH